MQNSRSFADAIAALDASIQSHIPEREFSFVAFVAAEVRVQILREAFDKGVRLPPYLQCPRFFDLKTEYSRWHKHHPEVPHHTPITLASVCNNLGISPPPDSPSSSRPLDQPPEAAGKSAEDAVTLSRIFDALVRRSQPIEQHQDVLSHPVDLKEDMQMFMNECSNIIFLSNLPHDTTQGELESWFTQHGGRPIDFWTLRVPDQGKAMGSGFVAFSTHEEAVTSFTLNGKCLNDRVIEVSPSSPSILERASEILVHFPQSKNRPRPGDWNCPKCGFSNFQRRTACFRCGYPLPIKPQQQQQQQQMGSANNSPHKNNGEGGDEAEDEYQVAESHAISPEQDGSSSSNSSFSRYNNNGPGYPTGPRPELLHQSRSTTPKNGGPDNSYAQEDGDTAQQGVSTFGKKQQTPLSSLSRSKSHNFNRANSTKGHLSAGNSEIYGEGLANNGGGGYNNNSGNQSLVPFRAGDWKCAREGCNYHNFAKNINCLRCGGPRAPSTGSEYDGYSHSISPTRRSSGTHPIADRHEGYSGRGGGSNRLHESKTGWSQNGNFPETPQGDEGGRFGYEHGPQQVQQQQQAQQLKKSHSLHVQKQRVATQRHASYYQKREGRQQQQQQQGSNNPQQFYRGTYTDQFSHSQPNISTHQDW